MFTRATSKVMTPSRSKIHVLFVIVATALAEGCSPTRPPVDELAAASRALASARAADAPTLAPADYRAASQELDQAKAAENHQDYDIAAQFARQSAADGELAFAKARLGKARASVDQLRRDNAALDHDLSEHSTPESQP
jgi:hypothetical protein